MRGKRAFLVILLVLLIIVPMHIRLVSAISGKTTLLAVAELEDGEFEGRTATLTLDIKDGSGQVFISTYPFSKVDTQVSTRFARDIACQYLERDCSNLDFSYTIKATGGIIAGPSAGAATTALTIALLKGKQLDESMALTGTINSGGIIGHVGGIKQKVEAAVDNGLVKVLVPLGEGLQKDGNETIDLFNFTNNRSAELVEVSDIEDALYEFGIIKKKQKQENFEIDESYSKVMELLARDLCNRSDKLKLLIENKSLDNFLEKLEYTSADERAKNLLNKSETAFEEKDFYSAASYCFGANVQRSFMYYLLEDITNYDGEVSKLESFIFDLEQEIDSLEKKTITDLESYMAVKERLAESREYLEKFNESQENLNLLAYGKERLYSAYSWRAFLNNRGKRFKIDKSSLKESCGNILGEAQEKYQYLYSLFPSLLDQIEGEIDTAADYYKDEEFELCMFTASKAKARSNVLLSSMNVREKDILLLIDQKLSAAKRVISKESSRGIFPILGYSYYEYAQNLKDEPYSALLYAEYALELSNLNIYFKSESIFEFFNLKLNKDAAIAAVLGFALGIIVVLLFFLRNKFRIKPGKVSGSIRFKRF